LQNSVQCFILRDELDPRPRVRFTIVNDYLDPLIKAEIYALFDTNPMSELILPKSLAKTMDFKATGKNSSSLITVIDL
jgi:hypothetical protein